MKRFQLSRQPTAANVREGRAVGVGVDELVTTAYKRFTCRKQQRVSKSRRQLDECVSPPTVSSEGLTSSLVGSLKSKIRFAVSCFNKCSREPQICQLRWSIRKNNSYFSFSVLLRLAIQSETLLKLQLRSGVHTHTHSADDRDGHQATEHSDQ